MNYLTGGDPSSTSTDGGLRPDHLSEASKGAYLTDSAKIAREFQVDVETGLSPEEARRRLEIFGPNELRGKPPVPLWKRVLAQLSDPLVILLLIAAVISAGAWILEGASGAPIEAIVVLLVVVFNVVIGVAQEARAADAVAALAQMTEAQTTVLRGGQQQSVPASNLVPGDVMILAEGDQVGADGRLFRTSSLRIAEASLTGESTAVEKSPETLERTVPLGDRRDMAYRGTAVVGGSGQAIVVATGMATEVGSIATMLDEAEEDATPLEQEINGVSKLLGRIVIAVALIIMITIAVVQTPSTPSDWVTIFMLGVSLAVAAVPEGLPAILSIVLAIGVQKMARRNAVVKKLSSAETLGSASVICTDKTGTLTQNEMTIKLVITASGVVELSGVGYAPEGEATARPWVIEEEGDEDTLAGERLLAEAAAVLTGGSLANDGALTNRDGAWEITGDPTDAAFLTAVRKLAGAQERVERAQRLADIPFSSDRKMMSTLQLNQAGELVVVSKGAPDVLLQKCNRVVEGDGIVPLTEESRERLLQQVNDLSKQAYRTLAVAARRLPASASAKVEAADFTEEDEVDLVYLGVVGIIDPPREVVPEAIEQAHEAGIRVVMITGDHPATAHRIAVDLGISKEDEPVLAGPEIDELTDEGLLEAVRDTSVFARVAPEHKLKIVDALQEQGHVVAMTGDGVNDAPALKSADIGIAMGVTGTEVTKEAGKMVLADDNFATIVAAVRQGRIIFENIRKFLRYLLSSNMGEVLTMFFGVVLMDVIGLRVAGGDGAIIVPLLATQILWINLVTDTGPALAVGVDPELDDVMAKPPRGPQDRVIDRMMWASIFTTGFAMAIGTLFVMDLWLPGGLVHFGGDSVEMARTAAFTTLVLGNFFSAFNARSATQSAFVGMFTNRLLWGAVALGFVLQVAVVEVPFLQAGFGTISLDLAHWLVAFAAASLVLWAEETRKLIVRARFRSKGPVSAE